MNSTKQSKKGTLKQFKTYYLGPFLIFVALSISSCCSVTEPPKVKPDKQFKSLERLKKSDEAPADGWWMSDEDMSDLTKILLEVRRNAEGSGE